MDLLIHTKHNISIFLYLDQIWFWKKSPITFSQGCMRKYGTIGKYMYIH